MPDECKYNKAVTKSKPKDRTASSLIFLSCSIKVNKLPPAQYSKMIHKWFLVSYQL